MYDSLAKKCKLSFIEVVLCMRWMDCIICIFVLDGLLRGIMRDNIIH